MRMPSPGTMRWLLLSDLHFKDHDLDRIRQTGQWIVEEAERNQIGRAVVCGDLLTDRKKQLTHVLSECYRFIGLLNDVVPRVHIVLGNHDLAYRRDYQTTALNALNMKRLAPYVSLHSVVAHHEWDGRRVLLLPFREEQNELTEAVAALGAGEASETVAFAHLAINKAITQRFMVGTNINNPCVANSVTHRGLTGPDKFASLARTFTGHFHSHQTITQERFDNNNTNLRGSVTYLGSPLQLNWADLYDMHRGVVLFDPVTLEHSLLVNPHAVGYITADIEEVLGDQVDEATVMGKYVMLIGKLTHLGYAKAREKLLSLGVRSVRDWTPMGLTLKTNRSSFGGLGASVPASDAAVQPVEELVTDEAGLSATTHEISSSDLAVGPRNETLHLISEARGYVESLCLDESLVLRRDELVRVGQRMIQVSREVTDEDDMSKINYQDFLDTTSQIIGTRTTTKLAGSSTHVFVAEPRALVITNFLGVQNTITIDFQRDLPRGLIFLVGDNGSGKSTLIEAMAWCQFGQCIRSGVAVNDVVNDSVGKNCCVKLEFANGYTIARYRKHKTYKYRVIVLRHGEPQPHLEQPDPRTTQEGINELLGTDYDTYVKTVVLSHESAVSFLNSKVSRRYDLIETSLGLSMLNHCGQLSKGLLKNIDADMDKMKYKQKISIQTIDYHKQRLQDMERTQKILEDEAVEAVLSSDEANQVYTSKRAQVPELNMDLRLEILTLESEIQIKQEGLQRLVGSYARLQDQLHAESMSWQGRLQQQLSQRLDAMAAVHPFGIRKVFHATEASVVHALLMAVRRLLRMFGIPKSDPCETSTLIHNKETAINSLRQEIEDNTSRLQTLKEKDMKQVATVNKHLEEAAKAQKHCETLKQQVMTKKSDIATYKRLAEDEQSSLHSLRLECDALAKRLEELAADRELFVFWSSALAKRKSSSPSSITKAATNFREHIVVNSLSELNSLLVQVLTVLYGDTRHAHLATGMLRSLFDFESASDMSDTSFSGSVLDSSLAVNSSLSYNKRSSGERKRIDLGLFFALLQLARARSAHRAHYVLIDEVFDNLDKAGQAAVVRWCSVMSRALVGWIVVITHSQFLVGRDLGEDVGLAQGIDLSSKRGLAYKGDDHKSDNDLLLSNNSEIAWYYTWSLWPNGQLGSSLPFVPLIHGLDDAKDKELEKRLDGLPDSSTHLLTFNEPDGETDTGGSSISAKDAAKAYMENIVPLRKAKRKWSISHPSVTGSPRGLEWLRDFNESCYDIDDNGCPTDFVAVHWYGDAGGLQNWLGSLREFYNETAPDAPFWITEMALPKEDEDATFNMMNESLSYLDGAKDVEAYAWFGAFRTNDANEWTGKSVSLFDKHGGLTKLGAEYLGGEAKGFEEGQSKGSIQTPSKSIMLVMMLASAVFLW
ncbi:hypothetical protein F53441_12294 [Fusarium austroafricanum]|uniref:Rad50/SbcC-type AAA domain-containing protein n=1 Tax=Fusarium austroafricanum TaxID=2364996 RepID=A0A8H4JYW1_9HYPO|nr:hypothetical protein F53441_12294 [Fusarium austroafricanum]